MSRYYLKGIPKISIRSCGFTYVSVLFTEHTYGNPPAYICARNRGGRLPTLAYVHSSGSSFWLRFSRGFGDCFGLFYGLGYLLSKTGFIRYFVESSLFLFGVLQYLVVCEQLLSLWMLKLSYPSPCQMDLVPNALLLKSQNPKAIEMFFS